MIKAVIVDDEILVLDLLNKLLQAEGIEIIGAFTNSKKALEMIPELKPDMAFLDIEMPGMNGIELATRLLDQMEDMKTVFVTAYDQYAIEAFKINAIHYIMKPPSSQDLRQAISRISSDRSNASSRENRHVTIRLFGGISIEIDGEVTDVRWPTVKAEELFALLVLHREKGMDKWQIIDKLWPDSPGDKGEKMLYTTVYRVKRTLADLGISVLIQNKLGLYAMRIKEASCDVWEYEDHMESLKRCGASNEEDCRQLINLYGGRLFGIRNYAWSLLNVLHYEKEFEKYCGVLNAIYLERDNTDMMKEIQYRLETMME